MADHIAYSHSPRVRERDPVTPVHSAHHSVNSSISSRTPLHTLTLHEYRKQQNSPASQFATPPGKTLRRKAAAPALNEVERVSSISRTPLSASRPIPRPLSLSRSAHQLSYQPLPPSPPHATQQHPLPDPSLRSQSAEPHRQGGIASGDLFCSSSERVRTFKSIKKLPKPPAANGITGFGLPPPPLAPVTSTHPRLSPLRTTSFPSAENSDSNGTQTTPSTFSLSRFPQPPHLVDPSLSPPNDENEHPRLNAVSFTTTAPATPPATPAIYHYRGTSFDLLNPHESLAFHDIVTPSRDLDSSDYLPLRSSESPLGFSEMAPKRALYGDLSSAYQNITSRRTDDPPATPNLDLPVPPIPVARSPGSSQYTSPLYSPDSDYAVSPLSVRKPGSESRFSLKQLTRSLTKKLGKTPEKVEEQELQDFSESRVSIASASFDGEYPRPLKQSYPAVTPKSPSFSGELPTSHSPVSPLGQTAGWRDSDVSVEYDQFTSHQYDSAPLTSMVPDDPSSQLARGEESELHPSLSGSDMLTKPYYDDLQSIYPSSSVYTGDGQAQSNYAPSLSSTRQSNPYMRYSGGADALAKDYQQGGPYAHSNSRRTSRRTSRPLTQDIFRRSIAQQGNEKTDTISKFIDHYGEGDGTNTSMPTLNEHRTSDNDLRTSASGAFEDAVGLERPQPARITSGLSQFEFNIPQDNDDPLIQPGFARKPAIAYSPAGSPPPVAAPLAPAFEYDEFFQAQQRPEQSGMFSGASSYGDTRQLLQLSQPMVAEAVDPEALGPPSPGRALEPSSSYSQPDAQPSPHTPQEALDQAEQIFESARAERKEEAGIPAMWARRSSGNLLRSKQFVDNDADARDDYHQRVPSFAVDDAVDNNGDWETENGSLQHQRVDPREDIGDWETENGSQIGRPSADMRDSIADYSSSEGSGSSLGFSRSLPRVEQPVESGSSYYNYPSPLPAHNHPFSSSPPPMTRVSARSAPDEAPPSSPVSSPPVSWTMPAFRGGYGNIDAAASPTQPFGFAPWTDPFPLSNKETQELLASGPNEEILYESPGHEDAQPYPRHGDQDLRAGHPSPYLERENTFDKFSVVGPKGNLTGTPQGTGMHEVGSSIADNSSPGAVLRSSPSDRTKRQGYPAHYQTPSKPATVHRGVPSFLGNPRETPNVNQCVSNFYVTPDRRASVTRIKPRVIIPEPEHERTPSQVTLFPRVIPEEDFSEDSRRSSRSFSSLRRPSRHSRSAVPGQTKLRHMVLAPDARTLSSEDSTQISRIIRTADSERPSSSNTHTPLRAHISESTMRSDIANEYSPHLLCPERAMDPEEEEQRRKLSWVIFAIFCILPPMLILYRSMADFVIVNVTKGRILHAAAKPKRIALGVGIVINVGLSGAILIPILIAHATGAL